jgi:hypothetical protein
MVTKIVFRYWVGTTSCKDRLCSGIGLVQQVVRIDCVQVLGWYNKL